MPQVLQQLAELLAPDTLGLNAQQLQDLAGQHPEIFNRGPGYAQAAINVAKAAGMQGGDVLPFLNAAAKDNPDYLERFFIQDTNGNTGTNGTITVTVKWDDIKVHGSQSVRDLWRQKDLGKFKDEFSLPVAPHSAELVKISP